MKPNAVKNRVLRLCGITKEEYATAVFESGIAFLEHYTNYDEWAVSTISRTHQFWGWWENAWYNIDEIFVARFFEDELEENLKPHYRRDWYLRHRPEKVQAMITNDVLNAASEIFEQLTKQKV